MNVRLVSLIVGFLTCLPLARSADQDLQARFEKSMNDAKSLVNIEIEFFDILWVKDPAFSRTLQYSYIASRLKYRARSKLISGTETNLAQFFESTFDGKLYASYDDKRYMTRRSGNPGGDNGACPFNPLIAPFVFLSKQSDDCMQCMLRFTDLDSRELTGLILPKGQRSNGSLEISMPGLSFGKKPTVWKITIDEAGDSFTPKMIRRVAPGAGFEGVYKLLNYTNLGAYRFPTKIEWTESAYPPTSPPTLLQTGTVTVISAHIPDQIADSTFELDETQAAVVWDSDKKKLTKMDPTLAKSRFKANTARNVLVIMILVTIVVVPIVVAKRSSSKRG